MGRRYRSSGSGRRYAGGSSSGWTVADGALGQRAVRHLGIPDHPHLAQQAVAVGRPHHGHLELLGRRRHQVVVGDRDDVREHLLARRELADRDAAHPVRAPAGELGVDLRVVLAVVADEQPLHVRQLAGEPVQLGVLVLLAGPEPARVGRPPVGEQHRPGGKTAAAQEPGEQRRGVPRPGRQVDDRGVRVLGEQLAVHRRHPRHRPAGALRAHEGVPGGDHRPGQRRRQHRVVDVGDDAVGHRACRRPAPARRWSRRRASRCRCGATPATSPWPRTVRSM